MTNLRQGGILARAGQSTLKNSLCTATVGESKACPETQSTSSWISTACLENLSTRIWKVKCHKKSVTKTLSLLRLFHMLAFCLLLWIAPFPSQCSDPEVGWRVSLTETAKPAIILLSRSQNLYFRFATNKWKQNPGNAIIKWLHLAYSCSRHISNCRDLKSQPVKCLSFHKCLFSHWW